MTTSPKPKAKSQSVSVMITVGMFVAAIAVFVIVLASNPTGPDGSCEQTGSLTSDSCSEEVKALLANADPARGEELVTKKYECGACHIQGANKTAPEYAGLSERAATAHPPLTAETYIYESIMYPAAHMVEGFANTMPANYKTRLTEQELGDIIAFLLTQ
jgi:cytochrome c